MGKKFDSTKKEVGQSAEQFTIAVRNSMNPDKIMLYGSHAKGTAHDESDIDIAVIFRNFKGNWLDISGQLWRFAWNIDRRIEPILLDTEHDDSGFCKHILETGIVL